jgi:hypothetical protein
MWNLQFSEIKGVFKIVQLSDLWTNGVAEDYLRT